MMLWVTWRQHRAELGVAVLLLAAVAIPLAISGLAMHEAYQADGAAACVADPTSDRGCAAIVDQFVTRHIEWSQRLIWVALLPALAGVFVGAPLLAREFEHGTWKLAFTQSVTRTRWLAVKLTLGCAGLAVVAVAFATLFTWWRTPFDAIGGRMHTTGFAVAAPSLTAVTLFAFAIGVLAGALLRRVVVAMVATLVVYFTVRVPAEEHLRPQYMRPRLRITDPVIERDTGWRPDTEWVVNSGWVDRTGRRLSNAEEAAIYREIYRGDTASLDSNSLVERYLAEHGLRHYAEYHTDEAFWTFQLIEAALYLAATATLLTAAVWVVRRRTT